MIVKEETATYTVIEPGDGTRYSAFWHHDFQLKEIVLAFGPGQYPKACYAVPIDNLKYELRELLASLKDKGEFSRFNIASYWASNSGCDNKWTAIAAMLFTGSILFGDPDDYLIIGHLYRGRIKESIEILDKWEEWFEYMPKVRITTG